MAHITTYYKGNGLLVHKEVADLNEIPDGYKIKTEQEFWEILRANCEHGIDRCTQLIEDKKPEKQN